MRAFGALCQLRTCRRVCFGR